MGILSRLFGKKTYDSVKEFDEELTKFQQKNASEMMALVGTGGRLKGLPLVYSTENETDLKKYAARLIELIAPIKVITEGKSIERFTLIFDEKLLYFKPITQEVCFFAVLPNSSNMLSIQSWVNKKAKVLQELFQEDD